MQDTRPDLAIVPGDLHITRNGNNVTGGMFGMQFKINATARNIGESPASDVWFQVGVRNETYHFNQTLFDQGYGSLDSNITGNSINVSLDFSLWYSFDWDFDIWACVDVLNLVNESNEANNFLTLGFTFVPLQTETIISTDKAKYTSKDDLIIVTATVRYAGTDEPAHVLLSFYLVDRFGNMVPDTETAQMASSSYDGYAVAVILLPPRIKDGTYYIGMKVLDDPQVSSTSVEISNPDPRIVILEALAIAVLIIAAAVSTIILALKWRDSRRKR